MNEGWYKNIKDVASRFMYYSSLRAIENRRSIARSSNEGISCFINQRGEINHIVSGFQNKAIKGNLYLNNKITFYTKHGDYIGKISVIIVLLFSIAILIKIIISKIKS